MVLGKLPVPGRPTNSITVGQGPIALAEGAGGGCLDIFTLIYPFSPFSPSLWETARYRLKYCLKGPLKPKQPTNRLPEKRRKRRERIDESKNVQTIPTRTYCKLNRYLPYYHRNCRTPGTGRLPRTIIPPSPPPPPSFYCIVTFRIHQTFNYETHYHIIVFPRRSLCLTHRLF